MEKWELGFLVFGVLLILWDLERRFDRMHEAIDEIKDLLEDRFGNS
jgi:hypothetical protein